MYLFIFTERKGKILWILEIRTMRKRDFTFISCLSLAIEHARDDKKYSRINGFLKVPHFIRSGFVSRMSSEHGRWCKKKKQKGTINFLFSIPCAFDRIKSSTFIRRRISLSHSFNVFKRTVVWILMCPTCLHYDLIFIRLLGTAVEEDTRLK